MSIGIPCHARPATYVLMPQVPTDSLSNIISYLCGSVPGLADLCASRGTIQPAACQLVSPQLAPSLPRSDLCACSMLLLDPPMRAVSRTASTDRACSMGAALLGDCHCQVLLGCCQQTTGERESSLTQTRRRWSNSCSGLRRTSALPRR